MREKKRRPLLRGGRPIDPGGARRRSLSLLVTALVLIRVTCLAELFSLLSASLPLALT